MFAATNFNEVINSSTGEICFDTYSRICSQYAGNKSYDVSIFDVTGYLTHKSVHVSPGSCLHTPARAHSVCAPFSINISTHSHQQSSNSVIHTIASGICTRCTKSKCMLTVSIASSVNLGSDCLIISNSVVLTLS